jgi:protein-S-isoprenylcysteine O-methyltransferase Ste14
MQGLERRIIPPVVFAICAGLMAIIARVSPVVTLPDSARTALTLALILAGLLIMGSAVLAFRRRGTTINPVTIEKASALVTSGVFRLSRNPMYLAMAIFLTAWTVFLAAPVALLGIALFVAYITRFQILPEERALEALFGDDYRDYIKRVRRWV